MNSLLWVMVILAVIEVAGGIRYGVQGRVPERTPTSMALSCAFWMIMGLWAFWLLATGAAR